MADNIIDKKNVLGRIDDLSPVILDLGCGPKKRNPLAIGIDTLDYECVDIVGDVFAVLSQMRDSTVDEVHSRHFFEHVSDIGNLVDELGRILKPGGHLTVVVPHFSNPYFYSDYTHKTFFGLYTFSYLSRDRIHRRRVPNYKRTISFELRSVKLGFYSDFFIRRKLKRLIGKIINLNNGTREFYEENLSHIFPCYEIHYHLTRIA